MGEYREKAQEAAKDAANYFFDEIVDEIVSSEGETKKVHVHDYSDSYASESLADDWYNLREAADVLEDLSEFEADDPGLWEGADPRRAISIMASETFRNAAESMFTDLMEAVNTKISNAEDETLFWDFDSWLEEAQNEGGKGVLDWRPIEEGAVELDPDVKEKLEEDFEKRREEHVRELVREAIDNW